MYLAQTVRVKVAWYHCYILLIFTLKDIEKCLQALEELGSVQVTSHILQKNADVIATLKKVWSFQKLLRLNWLLLRNLQTTNFWIFLNRVFWSLQIRRYKASGAVMEKATSVYNKLKLQFIGKIEPNNSKPDQNNQENNTKEAQNTGELLLSSRFEKAFTAWIMYLTSAIESSDSKPVNGESEGEKKEGSDSEENPKSADQENQDENKSPNSIR